MPGKSYSEWVEYIADNIQKRRKSFNRRDFTAWLLSKKKIYIYDWQLIYICYRIRNRLINKNEDHVITLGGRPGYGKSTLSFQIAYLIYDDFDYEDINLDVTKWIKRVINGTKGQAITMDEGGVLFNSKRSMSKSNKLLWDIFQTIRQKNLCLIICLPNLYDLDAGLRKTRIDHHIQLIGKGKYKAFKAGAMPYIESRRRWAADVVQNIPMPFKYYFKGSWNKELPDSVQWDKYNEMKMEHLKSLEREADDLAKTFQVESDLLPTSEVAKQFGRRADNFLNSLRREGAPISKIAGKYYINKQYIEEIKATEGADTFISEQRT